MTTLQELLSNRYPAQEQKKQVKEININLLKNEIGTEKIEGGELDLSEYTNLEELVLDDLYGTFLKTPLTKLKLGSMPNLVDFSCSCNELSSVDFLNELAHPEKMENLSIVRNNFRPTTLDFLRRFTGLKFLTLGTAKDKIETGVYNRFYGSLEPLKNLHNLKFLCIAGTDVNDGLEYLPLPKLPSGKRSGGFIDCQPLAPQAKVRAIQDQLRPFNYDIWAWQLAHPEKVLKAQPKLFSQNRWKEEWEKELVLRIARTEKHVSAARQAGRKEELARLESCLKLLKEARTKKFLPTENWQSDNNNFLSLSEKIVISSMVLIMLLLVGAICYLAKKKKKKTILHLFKNIGTLNLFLSFLKFLYEVQN